MVDARVASALSAARARSVSVLEMFNSWAFASAPKDTSVLMLLARLSSLAKARDFSMAMADANAKEMEFSAATARELMPAMAFPCVLAY